MSLRIFWISEVVPAPDSGAGGTELHLVEALRAQGHRVDCVWADDLPRRIAHGNLHYLLELPSSYARQMCRAAASGAYDVVTFNLGAGYLGARRLRRAGFPGVVVGRSHGLDDHLHEIQDAREGGAMHDSAGLRARASRILRRRLDAQIHEAVVAADGYVVSNSLDASFLQMRHGLASERILRITQAVPEGFLSRPATPVDAQRLRALLYVAGFHPLKGPDTAARAASSLLMSDPSLTMTWICARADHERVRRLFDPAVQARVRCEDWMPQAALMDAYDRHGILLYPSVFDGFGKVFLEAMSRGLCVIGTRAGGMPDLIVPDRNGFLTAIDAPGEIVAAARRLLADPAFAARVSTAAIAAAAVPTWSGAARALAEFFTARLCARQG